MDQEAAKPPRPPATFQPGDDERRERSPRRRGVQNQIPAAIKRAIFDGAVRHGRDGKGAGGFEGYCEFLAARHPEAFAGLLGRVLPVADDYSKGSGVMTINIVGVPSGQFLSKEEIEASEELPPSPQLTYVARPRQRRRRARSAANSA